MKEEPETHSETGAPSEEEGRQDPRQEEAPPRTEEGEPRAAPPPSEEEPPPSSPEGGGEEGGPEEEKDSGKEEEKLPPPPPLPQGVSLEELLEAMLFASPDALSAEKLAGAAGRSQGEITAALRSLEARLREGDRPYLLAQVGRGWRLLTKPHFHPYLVRLRGIRKRESLSRAALETLAVIAYRQPIIRAEIEDIRGVRCGPMLRALLERKLIKVAGRADVPGRPLLYATTRTFLDKFGLRSLKDLPSLKELKEGRNG